MKSLYEIIHDNLKHHATVVGTGQMMLSKLEAEYLGVSPGEYSASDVLALLALLKYKEHQAESPYINQLETLVEGS